MKPQEKAKELLCANCNWRVECEEEKETCQDYDKLIEMHEWSKEKALKAFCYANCTEPTKKGCECEKSCKEYLIFKRKMEE